MRFPRPPVEIIEEDGRFPRAIPIAPPTPDIEPVHIDKSKLKGISAEEYFKEKTVKSPSPVTTMNRLKVPNNNPSATSLNVSSVSSVNIGNESTSRNIKSASPVTSVQETVIRSTSNNSNNGLDNINTIPAQNSSVKSTPSAKVSPPPSTNSSDDDFFNSFLTK